MALAPPLPTVAERRRSRLWGVPRYWHLLSLDAPTVAVLWAWSFARAMQVHVSATALAVLGTGTWLVYVADRLLDARSAGHPALRERHFFHARHRGPLLHVSLVTAVGLIWLISAMPRVARREDTLVFAGSMLYLAVVHLPFANLRRWFPRELAVGVLFACATAVPAWSQPDAPRVQLALLASFFAGLCCLNCVAIEIWERSGRPARTGLVHAFAVGLALDCAALVLNPEIRHTEACRLAASVFASAILLLILDRLHRRTARQNLSPERAARFLLALRIGADAALLTPILFVLPWRP